MHWILDHMFYVVLVMLIVVTGVMIGMTLDLPRWRRATAMSLYGSIIAYLFYVFWTTGNVLPPPTPAPPKAWPIVLSCQTTYQWNVPRVKDGDRRISCTIIMVNPQGFEDE